MPEKQEKPNNKKAPSVFGVLKPYGKVVGVLVVLTMAANALTLVIPRIVAGGIDDYSNGALDLSSLSIAFVTIAVFMLAFSYGQTALQAYVAERAARDLRNRMADRISGFSYARLEEETPAKLLTNLTTDIDAIKQFIAFGVVMVISSLVLILGSAGMLLYMDWKLALVVLAIIPAIMVAFGLVFKNMTPLFGQSMAIIDKLNASINESILGSALVRVFNSRASEETRFAAVNTEARDNSMKILRLFSIMIPIVGIIANLASAAVLALGGRFVIGGSMTIGDFTAFQSYLIILIFPIIMLAFVSSMLGRAQASYGRVVGLIDMPKEAEKGTYDGPIRGDVEARGLTLTYGEKSVLKNVSFKVPAGTRAAIVGPTAAGKTQLLYALIGLIKPTSGEVLVDSRPLDEYTRRTLHAQAAIVFQDSVMFNMTIRENVAFGQGSKPEDVERAIRAAELGELDVNMSVSERGTSLSGGQKQRIMLARALALNPKILFLDDFTARVDSATEAKILGNVAREYPGITVVSVTQKVSSAKEFDQVVLLMEGEVLATGTHDELVRTSTEYAQIAESQKSTNAYERIN